MNAIHSMNGAQPNPELQRRIRRGLFFADWHRHRQGVVLAVGSIAVMAFAIGAVEQADAIMLGWLSVAMALGIGFGLGRGEWLEDGEEFALTLPPRRRDRFLVRMLFGLVLVATFYLIGMAAGPLGWVRGLWELTPIALPEYDAELGANALTGSSAYYLLVAAVALALYAESYSLSMAMESRGDLRWARELPLFALLFVPVLWLDSLGHTGPLGLLTALVALVFAYLRLVAGCRTYEHKDAVVTSGTVEVATRKRLLVAGTMLAILLTLALLGVLLYARTQSGG